MKHTPGPWYVEGYEVVRDLVDGTVVQKYTVMSVTNEDRNEFALLAANARLIAKAPEMLTLLELWLATATAESSPAIIAKTEALLSEIEP